MGLHLGPGFAAALPDCSHRQDSCAWSRGCNKGAWAPARVLPRAGADGGSRGTLSQPVHAL